MSDPNEKGITELQADVDRAREWARKHFNADAESNTLLDPPSHIVEFPDIDRMIICAQLYHRPLTSFWLHYRLCWLPDGGVGWRMSNPPEGWPTPVLRCD